MDVARKSRRTHTLKATRELWERSAVVLGKRIVVVFGNCRMFS